MEWINCRGRFLYARALEGICHHYSFHSSGSFAHILAYQSRWTGTRSWRLSQLGHKRKIWKRHALRIWIRPSLSKWQDSLPWTVGKVIGWRSWSNSRLWPPCYRTSSLLTRSSTWCTSGSESSSSGRLSLWLYSCRSHQSWLSTTLPRFASLGTRLLFGCWAGRLGVRRLEEIDLRPDQLCWAGRSWWINIMYLVYY